MSAAVRAFLNGTREAEIAPCLDLLEVEFAKAQDMPQLRLALALERIRLRRSAGGV